MERWNEAMHEDHRALASQAGALEAALTIDVSPQDRRVVLSWIIRTLWPELELHLRKEEEVLFPALQRLLGENAGVVTLLREQHQELRSTHRRLAELLQGYEDLNWEGIQIASESLIELLEDHEKKVSRLLLDVLEFNLKPQELKALAQAFEAVARKAREEEGWPSGVRPRRRTETKLAEAAH